ncbi:MAG TPA: hypothetical protein VK782_10455 [Candidatus Sulfotelmatobacter sp.]|nr:hypothetical protein [Candidatus Sulfotelmatobacter sp.]
MKIIGLLVLAFMVSGCALLAAPGIEGAASLAGMAGNSATGYMSTHSSIELNAANVELVKAQAQMQKVQADDLRNKREELEDERAATVGILREMAIAREDPTLADMALWVQAGGDPDYAMHYALQGPPKTIAKE